MDIILTKTLNSATLRFCTDATGLGKGGVMGSHWLIAAWPVHFLDKHIDVLEIFAVFTAQLRFGAYSERGRW